MLDFYTVLYLLIRVIEANVVLVNEIKFNLTKRQMWCNGTYAILTVWMKQILNDVYNRVIYSDEFRGLWNSQISSQSCNRTCASRGKKIANAIIHSWEKNANFVNWSFKKILNINWSFKKKSLISSIDHWKKLWISSTRCIKVIAVFVSRS